MHSITVFEYKVDDGFQVHLIRVRSPFLNEELVRPRLPPGHRFRSKANAFNIFDPSVTSLTRQAIQVARSGSVQIVGRNFPQERRIFLTRPSCDGVVPFIMVGVRYLHINQSGRIVDRLCSPFLLFEFSTTMTIRIRSSAAV
jgi:hypothetical protein